MHKSTNGQNNIPTFGNIILVSKIQQMELLNENPWERFLSSTMFAMRCTDHTTT